MTQGHSFVPLAESSQINKLSTGSKDNQRKNIAVEDLELLIGKEIEKYTILPEFLQWALEGLNKKTIPRLKTGRKFMKCNKKHYCRLKRNWRNLPK